MSETPRVTQPFSDAAWAALDALGEQVEMDLMARDVRLTMGGEPTFVSIDDYQSPEWTVAALGARKRVLADELTREHRRLDDFRLLFVQGHMATAAKAIRCTKLN